MSSSLSAISWAATRISRGCPSIASTWKSINNARRLSGTPTRLHNVDSWTCMSQFGLSLLWLTSLPNLPDSQDASMLQTKINKHWASSQLSWRLHNYCLDNRLRLSNGKNIIDSCLTRTFGVLTAVVFRCRTYKLRPSHRTAKPIKTWWDVTLLKWP